MSENGNGAAAAARVVGRRALQQLGANLGRRYLALEHLVDSGITPAAAQELGRLAQDVENEMRRQRQRGAREPWRR